MLEILLNRITTYVSVQSNYEFFNKFTVKLSLVRKSNKAILMKGEITSQMLPYVMNVRHSYSSLIFSNIYSHRFISVFMSDSFNSRWLTDVVDEAICLLFVCYRKLHSFLRG